VTLEDRVREFMDVVERRDHRALEDWFAEEAMVWIPPRAPVRGARRILAMFRVIFRRYAEIHWRVTAVHELGERRCMYLTDSWGKVEGDDPYHNHVMSLLEFDEAGRISSLSDYFKDTAIFQVACTSCGCDSAVRKVIDASVPEQ
jgi:limonene-1,2-epoxide hydrolase